MTRPRSSGITAHRPCGSAPARSLLARTQSEPGRRPARRARSAVEVELVEVTTEGDVNRAPLASLGGTGVFVSALRDALLRGEVDVAVHSLKDLPDRPADGHHARRRTAARGPARRRRRPRRAHPRRAARRQRGRHRLPAPGRPAARPRPRLGGRRHPRQRRHPDRQGRAPASSTPSSSPGPGWPGSAGSTRSPRCSTRCRCSPPPGRARWRSSAAPTTPSSLPRSAAHLDDPFTRAAVDAERAVLATLEAGCSAPVGALAEVVEGDDGDELWVRAVALSPRRRAWTSAGRRRGPLADAAGVGDAGWPTRACSTTVRQRLIDAPAREAARMTATQDRQETPQPPRPRVAGPGAGCRSSAVAPATPTC